jgi:hypothetical protein
LGDEAHEPEEIFLADKGYVSVRISRVAYPLFGTLPVMSEDML